MNKGIRCITIIHQTDEFLKFREIAGFFRLIGIFVLERTEWMEIPGDTDAVISLLEEDNPQDVSDVLGFLSDELGTEAVSVLKSMWAIYQNKNLMRGSYALDFFKNCNNLTIYNDMLKAYDDFSSALQQFEKLERQVVGTAALSLKYILAAQANCQRRMNQLYTILWDAIEAGYYGNQVEQYKKALWDRKYYFIPDMEKIVGRILEIDPEYYGAYAILALAEIGDRETKIAAMTDFERAVSLIGNRSHSSYLRYRMGRYYEYVLKRPKKSLMHYLLSYEADKYNYRAIYKLSVHEQSVGNYKRSIRYWNKLISFLSHKENTKALQPAECNYLFKAYKNKGMILFEQKKYEECYQEMKRAEMLYKDRTNEKSEGFYPVLFGNHASEYKKAAKEKLKIWRLYEFLAKVTPILGKYEEYRKYRDYAEKFKTTH